MTDIKIVESGGRVVFLDPLEDYGEPLYVMSTSDFPLSQEELVKLLGQIGNDVDYRPDPA